MADSSGYGLVVWKKNNLYRLESPLFRSGSARIVATGQLSLNLSVGLLGLDVSPRIFPNEPRYLYFHALTSHNLYMIDTQKINSFSGRLSSESTNIFRARNVFPSNAMAQSFSADGTMFTSLSEEYAIICWNRYRNIKHEPFVSYHS